MVVKTWKQQQSDRTREQLLDTARTLFGEKGYADTPIEELVLRAGMTRGALYHHFKDKRALFEAVLERTIEEVGDRAGALSKERVARESKHKRHPDRYLAGLDILLDELSDPVTRRLVLVEGPAVLGRRRLEEWLHGHVFRVVRAVIRTHSEEGRFPPRLIEPLSHLVVGAAQEAAQVVGDSADPKKARRLLMEAFRFLTAPILE